MPSTLIKLQVIELRKGVTLATHSHSQYVFARYFTHDEPTELFQPSYEIAYPYYPHFEN